MAKPWLILALTLAATSTSAAQTGALMPVPRTITWGSGSLRVDTSFTICIDGYHDGRLDRAARRALARLRGRTGLRIASSPISGDGTLAIRVRAAGMAVQGVDEDESYVLDVGTAVTL